MAASPRHGETVVSAPGWLAAMWIGLPLLGAGAGWLLQAVAGWLVKVPFVPFDGVLRAIDEVSDVEPWSTVGGLAVGALAGAVLAGLGALEHVTVTVSGHGVALRRVGETRACPRSDIAAAFAEGEVLVLLGHATEELLREKTGYGPAKLGPAFAAHGYRWLDGDPHRAEFRRWVPGADGLPPGADALLRAREKALEKGDKDDAAELRGELAALGVVVREEKKRQYWRQVPGD
ncbi:hypothetical protein GCM10027168_14600 [Streptomyces capparidis]